jgi:glutaredoxin
MAKVVMYGTQWCGDCIRSKGLLERNAIPFQYIDLDEHPEFSDTVIGYNESLGLGPKRRIPVILVDEIVLSEPSNEALAAALGISE